MTPETAVRAPLLQAEAAQALGPTPLPESYSWARRMPRTASTARRAVAFGADAVIVFLLAWMATFLAAAAGVLRIPDVTLFGRLNEGLALLWIVSIFELPILLLYGTLLEGLTGRTPGKVLTGLRVQRVDGKPVTIADGFVRSLLRLLWVTPFGPAFVLLDLWALQATELDQRMGDLAVGTIVVEERALDVV